MLAVPAHAVLITGDVAGSATELFYDNFEQGSIGGLWDNGTNTGDWNIYYGATELVRGPEIMPPVAFEGTQKGELTGPYGKGGMVNFAEQTTLGSITNLMWMQYIPVGAGDYEFISYIDGQINDVAVGTIAALSNHGGVNNTTVMDITHGVTTPLTITRGVWQKMEIEYASMSSQVTVRVDGDSYTYDMVEARESNAHQVRFVGGDPADSVWYIDAFTTEPTPARAGDFGQQYVRNNPFTIAGLASGDTQGGPAFDVNTYLGAGLNVVHSHNVRSIAQQASEAGVPWIVTSDDYEFVRQNYTTLPHATGIYVWDEPQDPAQMALAAEAVRNAKLNLPDLLVYVTALSHPGAYSTYDDYLNAIVYEVQPDVLMWDLYPFDSDGTTQSNDYFSYLMAVRNKALANNLPYWGWLQSYTAAARRTPSESDNRYNAFTLLTAGYTGFEYFLYDRISPDLGGLFLETDGSPTEFYNYAAETNREVANLGQSLRMLTSTDVGFVPGRHSDQGQLWENSPPTGLSVWEYGDGGDQNVVWVTVDYTEPEYIGLEKDGLIGFFTDDEGVRYFMLTNLYQGPDMTADEASLSFIMLFVDTIDSIWRLSRDTGLAEEILLTNHRLFLTLPGGTGDLFKYDDGNFAGLTPELSFLLGDANKDGLVSADDYASVQANFGNTGAADGSLLGDANHDGLVSADDYASVQANFGHTSGGMSAVPEPATLGLLAIGLIAVLRRRNK